MKTISILSLVFCFIMVLPGTMEAETKRATMGGLKEEITAILLNKDLNFLITDTQQVTVDFLINARNQLVILDAQGDSASACDYVKKMLGYKQVKYKQAKQLTHYVVNIRLIKNIE